MGFSNRRMLLQNHPIISTSIPPLPPRIQNNLSSPPPESMTPFSSSSSSSMYGMSLQFPPRPMFTTNFSHAFLVPFAALVFLGFLFFLYVRHLSAAAGSPTRRQVHQPSCQGVDPTVVKSLPVCPYDGDENQVDCAICLEDYQVGDTVKMIPYCKHVFHPECIDTWLDEHVTCPICRCTQFVDERGEEGSTAENREGDEIIGDTVRELGSSVRAEEETVVG